ncbi:hypothetical protein SDC9_27784 [bioreactor metagenome]|uniref:Uncharacterized protein n=1 Tax=bioreactor metagenome TaxID=1076179 RepID=A0A644UT15_9ZZZZ|nr:hypothetical protein [Paludibacter sp.]
MKLNKLIITALVLALTATSAMAQSDKSGPVLPKAGDIGFGVDLVPIFNYVGDFFNGTVGNTLNNFAGQTWDATGTPDAFMNPTSSFFLKYMLTDEIAARANVGIMKQGSTTRLYQQDDAAKFFNPLSEAEVIDSRISHRNGAAIALGLEYRRGYKRIQGYAGADLLYGFTKNTDRYVYGNGITEANQTPSRSIAAPFIVTAPIANANWAQTYVLEHYQRDRNQYLGADFRLGVEYFIASHLSLGGEVALYMYGKMGAQEWMKTEGWNATTNRLETRTETISPGNTALNIGTDNIGGRLYMMFYF